MSFIKSFCAFSLGLLLSSERLKFSILLNKIGSFLCFVSSIDKQVCSKDRFTSFLENAFKIPEISGVGIT